MIGVIIFVVILHTACCCAWISTARSCPCVKGVLRGWCSRGVDVIEPLKRHEYHPVHSGSGWGKDASDSEGRIIMHVERDRTRPMCIHNHHTRCISEALRDFGTEHGRVRRTGVKSMS